jgi:hypothetical protein
MAWTQEALLDLALATEDPTGFELVRAEYARQWLPPGEFISAGVAITAQGIFVAPGAPEGYGTEWV